MLVSAHDGYVGVTHEINLPLLKIIVMYFVNISPMRTTARTTAPKTNPPNNNPVTFLLDEFPETHHKKLL